MLKLDRNKIYLIGTNPKTVTIKQLDKLSNKELDSFEIYKCIRRKNKLYCRALGAKLKLTFNSLINAIKCNNQIKKELI